MAHDPRAPKVAAFSSLLAVILIVGAAVNAWQNFFGTSGLGLEEGILLVATSGLFGLAKWANSEHEIPEFNQGSTGKSSMFEEFGETKTPVASNYTTYEPTSTPQPATSNQTTASILTSILGQQQETNEAQVMSAISTLSSGEFGERAQQEAEPSEFEKDNNHLKAARPTNELTGAVLDRVVVQPVPLPGREGTPVVDPSSIPGLEPDRVFVTEGTAHIPLPELSNVEAGSVIEPSTPITVQATIAPVELPDLPNEPSVEPSKEVPSLGLPDLDDLFNNLPETSKPVLESTPELPDLDDLF